MKPGELSKLADGVGRLAAELRRDVTRDGDYTLAAAAHGLLLRLAASERKPAQRAAGELRPMVRAVRR